MNQIGHQNFQIFTNISSPTTVMNIDVAIVDMEFRRKQKLVSIHFNICLVYEVGQNDEALRLGNHFGDN